MPAYRMVIDVDTQDGVESPDRWDWSKVGPAPKLATITVVHTDVLPPSLETVNDRIGLALTAAGILVATRGSVHGYGGLPIGVLVAAPPLRTETTRVIVVTPTAVHDCVIRQPYALSGGWSENGVTAYDSHARMLSVVSAYLRQAGCW